MCRPSFQPTITCAVFWYWLLRAAVDSRQKSVGRSTKNKASGWFWVPSAFWHCWFGDRIGILFTSIMNYWSFLSLWFTLYLESKYLLLSVNLIPVSPSLTRLFLQLSNCLSLLIRLLLSPVTASRFHFRFKTHTFHTHFPL